MTHICGCKVCLESEDTNNFWADVYYHMEEYDCNKDTAVKIIINRHHGADQKQFDEAHSEQRSDSHEIQKLQASFRRNQQESTSHFDD